MAPDPERVQAVFLAALECQDPAERAAVLEAVCLADVELRQRIEALLRAHDQFDNSLEGPLATRGNSTASATGSGHPNAQGPQDHTIAVAAMASDSDAGPPSDLTVSVGVSSAHDERHERAAPSIEGYEVLGELGRGAMGVVYRAREILLNRPCVLKMILAGAHADAEAALRFLAEAEAVARLQHPNIVQIHHIGQTDGLPCFELEYVEGGSLDRQLDGTPWPALRAAALVEALARGVAEAHRLGIIHRDLKPGNVLLSVDGTPKIADFGLAKSLDRDSGLTRTDLIMGSPSYMAPEQAAGLAKLVGPPADIYALGAILYELLTGRPPFHGTTVLDTLEQVKSIEPVPPSRLVPGLARDVERIALKCLQKEPGKRYDSAAALSEDLRRFRGGESIVARPVPFWERGWRWCRRHPAPAALTAAVVLVAALGLAGILWQWNEAVQARNLAARRAIAEGREREKAQAARADAETTLVDMYTTSGVSAGDQGEHARAALWFANAARRAAADPNRRLANEIRARTWGRRAFTPLRAFVADDSWPGGFGLHPDGRRLITKTVIDSATGDARHTLWDLDAERSLFFPGGLKDAPSAAWSPDGRALAVGRLDGDVMLIRLPGGEEAVRIPFPKRIRLLEYSADGRMLAIAGGNSARVWDAQAQAFVTPDLVHPAAVTTLAFHPAGRYLATGCQDQQARLFAVSGDSARPLWPPVPHDHTLGRGGSREFHSQPLFVAGGRELITYSVEGGLSWRAAETGAEFRTRHFPDWTKGLASIVLSPGGRYFAVMGVMRPPKIQLLEVASGRVGPVLQRKNTVTCAAFSPDGRMLATSSTDATCRLWAVPSGEPLAQPLDLHRTVHLVAFAPNGRSLVTQDGDLVRLWALPMEGLPMSLVPLDGKSSFAALSPDGTLTIPTGMSLHRESTLRSTRAYHVATGRPAGPPLRANGLVVDAVFSPDGRAIAFVSGLDVLSAGAQELVVWDWASGRRECQAALPSQPRSLSYRPDGRLIAVLCGGGEVVIFDGGSGRELRRWRAHDAEPPNHWINNGEVRFSPDGRGVLTWGMGTDLRVWRGDTGELRYPPVRHRDKCHDFQFSPDGRLMALAAYDRSVRVRDFATAKVVTELPDHPDYAFSASFSSDGRLLVTACRDRAIRVWDWRAGRLVCPPFEHAKEAVAATFTPDSRWVLSASVDGTARVWDWRTGKPVTPPLGIDGEPLSIAVTMDGRHAVVGGGQKDLVVLDLSGLAPHADDADTAALCNWAELVAGQRLHEGGGTVNLSADEWLERWRVYRQQSPGDAGVVFPGESRP
jgi:WD40 repeat protein